MELPTAEDLLTAPSQTDDRVSDHERGADDEHQGSKTEEIDADPGPSEKATTTNHKTRRRKVPKHSSTVMDSDDDRSDSPREGEPLGTNPKKRPRPVRRDETGKRGKPSSENSFSSTTEEENDSSHDEGAHSGNSEDSADEVDYQLGKVLIKQKNCSLLSSSRHFPMPTRARLLNLTCREILASWLSMTQLSELNKIYGLRYKRGRFSTKEKTEIERMIKEFCRENSITVLNFVSLSRTKSRRGDPDSSHRATGSSWGETRMDTHSLISRISRNLNGRPNASIWQYIRRAYDPKSKQGPWTEEEEDLLQEAFHGHGSRWVKVSEIVGRSADDCRDRWRNYTVLKGTKNSGGWSREEEETLIELMARSESMGLGPGKDQGDGLWTWVSEQMGGSRSRAQCRIKWVEGLKPVLDAEGSTIYWTNRDVLTLAQKLRQHNLEDEVGFDWRMVTFGTWNPALLQRRWKQIKKFVVKKKISKDHHSSDSVMNTTEILEQVLDRWSHKSEDFLNSRVRFAKTNEKT